jgi:hypothetical protein
MPPPPPALPVPRQTEDFKVPEAEQEQSKHVTVEAAPEAPAQTLSVLPPGVSSEELSAIKIQTAFRGYLVMLHQLLASLCHLELCEACPFFEMSRELVVIVVKYFKDDCVSVYFGWPLIWSLLFVSDEPFFYFFFMIIPWY